MGVALCHALPQAPSNGRRPGSSSKSGSRLSEYWRILGASPPLTLNVSKMFWYTSCSALTGYQQRYQGALSSPAPGSQNTREYWAHLLLVIQMFQRSFGGLMSSMLCPHRLPVTFFFLQFKGVCSLSCSATGSQQRHQARDLFQVRLQAPQLWTAACGLALCWQATLTRARHGAGPEGGRGSWAACRCLFVTRDLMA